MQRRARGLLACACALALSACASVASDRGAAPNLAPAAQPAQASASLDAAAPDSMRWLYGSGEAAALSIQVWTQIANHALARARAGMAERSIPMGIDGEVRSMDCRDGNRPKPLAAVFDVDETVLLNLGYEYQAALGQPFSIESWKAWERDGAPHVRPVPGAAEALRRLREAGITPVFNTNRAFSPEGAARAIAAAGLGEVRHGETLFLRGDDEMGGRKDGRRKIIAQRFCVIALAGDNLGDIADLFNDPQLSPHQRRAMAMEGRFAELWGKGWFVLPNPVYGPGVSGTIGEIFPPATRWVPRAEPIMNEGE